jgi:hypothetical protein
VQNENTEIRFGNGAISAVGALAGLGIAVGVPWVVLEHAQLLNQAIMTGIVIAALLIGGVISLVSAFFGLVIPRHVGGPWGDPKAWAGWAEKWRQWEREGHEHARGRHWSHRMDREEPIDEDPQERAAPRRKRR